mgnify:CR=1 FL=1
MLAAATPQWRDDVAVVDWSLRVQLDQGFTLTDVDTSFFYFPSNLDQLDITPTPIADVALAHLQRYLLQRVGSPASSVVQIYNGVDTDRFHPAAAGGREALEGGPFNDPALWVIGTVGRLQKVKEIGRAHV